MLAHGPLPLLGGAAPFHLRVGPPRLVPYEERLRHLDR